MPDPTVLKVEKLSVEFNGATVVDGVSFSVLKGEVLAILGPNGAGKSVIFRALLDLVPYSGKISWAPDLKIGYVPQKLAIDRSTPLSVVEFLKSKAKNTKEILDVLKLVGINTGPESEHHLEHHILNRGLGKLSGGEFQRILIAWALIGGPNVLLFDEPTAGIDISGEETIYNLLKKIQQSNDLTLLLISHDLNIVYNYADKVICINKKALCLGEPHQVLDPKSLSVLYGGEAKFYHHEH
jgi:zinc transport system ATP-binding protein